MCPGPPSVALTFAPMIPTRIFCSAIAPPVIGSVLRCPAAPAAIDIGRLMGSPKRGSRVESIAHTPSPFQNIRKDTAKREIINLGGLPPAECAPVAQWIEHRSFGTEGRGFESLRAYHHRVNHAFNGV